MLWNKAYNFCRKDIFEILDKCEELKISFAILTNGTMADEETLQKLSAYKLLTYVRISIDYATDNRMDSFRGMKGILKTIRTTMGHLKRFGIPFGIGLTIMDDNIDDIYEVAKLARDSGAAFFRASPIASIGKSENVHHNIEFYCKAILALFEVRKKLNVGQDYPFFMMPRTLSKLSKYFLLPCPGGVHEISIMADGSVNRCPLSKIQQKYNIYELSFEESLQHTIEECRNSELDYIKNVDCKECKDIERCKGGCYVEYDNNLEAHPLCLKKILEMVSRSCQDEYIRIYGNIVYEQKLRGNNSGCMRSLALWVIPLGAN